MPRSRRSRFRKKKPGDVIFVTRETQKSNYLRAKPGGVPTLAGGVFPRGERHVEKLANEKRATGRDRSADT
jgi:hypothetical protein